MCCPTACGFLLLRVTCFLVVRLSLNSSEFPLFGVVQYCRVLRSVALWELYVRSVALQKVQDFPYITFCPVARVQYTLWFFMACPVLWHTAFYRHSRSHTYVLLQGVYRSSVSVPTVGIEKYVLKVINVGSNVAIRS